MAQPLILGFTGPFNSGCSTTAKYIQVQVRFPRFQYFSLSELVRRKYREVHEREGDRDGLQEMGNHLRRENGNDYLARELSRQFEGANYILIDSIRHPEELEYLQGISNLFLIAITAPKDIRKERERRKTDSYSEDVFEKNDWRDTGEDEPPWGQHVSDVVYRADVFLNNDEDWQSGDSAKDDAAKDTKDSYFGGVETYVKAILKTEILFPTLDELAMQVAYSVRLSARCYSRQVGAVIATTGKHQEQLFILAAACNNVPEGVGHCRAKLRYCDRRRKVNTLLSGLTGSIVTISGETRRKMKMLDYSRSLHAEENAILQIARLGGMSLKDATLYTTTFPCLLCTKKIIQCGLKRVVYVEPYPVEESYVMLTEALGQENVERFEGVTGYSIYRIYQRSKKELDEPVLVSTP